MLNIINDIINKVCKEVVILHRIGTYLTIDEVFNAILYELDKQHINTPSTVWIFNTSIPVEEYIKMQIKNKLKYKLKDYQLR